MPPKRKGRPPARATAAKAARHTRASSAMGAPPPSTSVDLEDAEELQEILAEAAARPAVGNALASPEAAGVAASGRPSRVEWERQVDARLANTDRLLQEMHGMLQSALTNTRPEAVGQPTSSTAAPVQEPAHPPWPSTSGMGFEEMVQRLPEATQERVSVLAASSLPIHSHVSEKIKNKIWAEEFVDFSTLLKTYNHRPDYSLTIQPGKGEGEPMVSVAPKAHTELKSFQQWNRAFEIFMSIYISKPSKVDQAPNLLKYMQTVRNLSDRAGDWLAYDEAFRSMRVVNSWGWDSVHWELWMNAAQSQNSLYARSTSANSPFHGKERMRPPTREKLCFAFNRGEPCYTRPCGYKHSCKNCGGRHSFTKCTVRFRNQRTQPASANVSRPQKTNPQFIPRK